MAGRVWQFMSGYVNIRLTGLSLHRLLNRALEQGVTVRNLRRVNHSWMEGRVSRADAARLADLARDASVTLTVLSRHGLPALGGRAVRRPGLLAGLAAMALVLVLLSRMILVVDITGVEDIQTEMAIRTALYEQGIFPGAVMPSGSLSKTENKILLKLPQLSFISIGRRGMRVTVEAVPKVQVQGLIDRDTPCSLVAEKDAIIVSILVQDGTAAVTPGMLVRSGQLLVSGRMGLSDGRVLLRHAMATIRANCWYKGEASQPTLRRVYRLTGEAYTRVTLGMGTADFVLYCQGEAVDYPSSRATRQQAPLLGTGFLYPLTLNTTVVEETLYETEVLNRDAILSELTRQARLAALAQVPEGARIVDETDRQSLTGQGVLTVTVYVKTEETIGTEVPLA